MARSWSARIAAVMAVAALGINVQACSKQSNPNPGFGASSVATVTPGLSVPVGPFERGTLTAANTIDPTTVGPKITLVTPTRGEQVTNNVIEVRVSVTDPDGVDTVEIAGAQATDLGNGEFGASVQLADGLNVVHIEATDQIANRSTSYVSVTQGTFAPAGQFLSRAVGLNLNDAGLRRVADITNNLTGGIDLNALIANVNPIFSATGISIDLLGLAHDPMRFAFDGMSNGIEVVVELDNVVVDLSVTAIGLQLTNAQITADVATGTIEARVDQQAFTGTGVGHRALGLEITNFDLALTNFRMTASSGVINALLQPFQSQLEDLVRDKLRDAILDLADTELQKPIPALDTPLTMLLPDLLNGGQSQIDLQIEVNEADGAPGAGVGLAGGFRAMVPAGQGIQGATNQVWRRGVQTTPMPGNTDPFAICLSDDALNGFVHAVWQSGLLRMELDGANPTAGLGIAMNVGYLYPFLPQVRDLAPDRRTPIRLELSVEAPPVAHIGRSANEPFQIDVGEVEICALIDYMDGQPPAELFCLRVSTTLGAQIDIVGSEIEITGLTAPHLGVEVVREPMADLADQEVEDFIHAIVPLVMREYAHRIPNIPIPGLPLGLSLSNVQMDVTPNFLTLRGSL